MPKIPDAKEYVTELYKKMFNFANVNDDPKDIGPAFFIVMSGLKNIESGNATKIDRGLIEPLINEAKRNDQSKLVQHVCLIMAEAGLIDATPTQQQSNHRFIR